MTRPFQSSVTQRLPSVLALVVALAIVSSSCAEQTPQSPPAGGAVERTPANRSPSDSPPSGAPERELDEEVEIPIHVGCKAGDRPCRPR